MGFGDSVRERMSPGLQRQIAEQEEAEAREAAKLERERAVRAETWRERSLQAAIAQAIADGENINPRRAMRGEGIGHSPQEFIEMMGSVQAAEDARAEALEARAYREWKAAREQGTFADTSAPTPEEVAAAVQEQQRTDFYLDRKRQREMAVAEAREQAAQDSARGDRQVLGRVAYAVGTALSGEAGYQTTAYRTEYGS